jgi:hypothetical protein
VKIDWAALGIVAVVSVVMTIIFVLLLSAGIRFVSAGRAQTSGGRTTTPVLGVGYALLGAAGLFVLFGIYLIVV